VGLGNGPDEWTAYEWVRLADLPPEPVEPLAEALLDWLADHPVWDGDEEDGAGSERVLLVDLDNLRAGPQRWRVRMAAVVALARQADHAFLAGQVGAVRRAQPYLAELADDAQVVPDGSDLADFALLDAVEGLGALPTQVVVISNDGIFAQLAGQGRLTVISPGRDALSSRLLEAAAQVIDLDALERAAAVGVSA